jgi:hypothetical protein
MYIISMIPMLPGDGVSITGGDGCTGSLDPSESRSYESGLVQLTYVPRHGWESSAHSGLASPRPLSASVVAGGALDGTPK